jgi:hypothetical protein
MGVLIAWRYPTVLFARLADHTYVSCGTGGKAWSCWGGKTGGTAFVQGTGSTMRADAIAQPDERANIKCYLVNGVCHQAANRILFPAGKLVVGARGYWVSEALFGPYGRVRGVLGLCRAPFYKHTGVSGDLPQCVSAPPGGGGGDLPPQPAGEAELMRYIEEVASLYEGLARLVLADALDEFDARSFQMTLFSRLVDFKLGDRVFAEAQRGALMDTRLAVEVEREKLEGLFFREEIGPGEFVAAFNELTIQFQRRIAEVLSEGDYRKLFDLSSEEPVVLGDPEIAAMAYGAR